MHCFATTLAKPLPAGDTAELDVTTVYTLIQTAYPATVQQGETQLMLYVDNLYVVSPYTVSAQVTEVGGAVKGSKEQQQQQGHCSSTSTLRPLSRQRPQVVAVRWVQCQHQRSWHAQQLQWQACAILRHHITHLAAPPQQQSHCCNSLLLLTPHPLLRSQVLLPSSDIKSFTQEKPVLNKDTRVTFGRYDRIEPFTLKEMKVHFANMKPFKQVGATQRCSQHEDTCTLLSHAHVHTPPVCPYSGVYPACHLAASASCPPTNHPTLAG